jgi:hypothetical protein
MVGVAAFYRGTAWPSGHSPKSRRPASRVHVMSIVQVLNIAAAMVLALLFAAGLGGFAVLVKLG